MAKQKVSKRVLAADAWRGLFDFVDGTSGRRLAVLGRLGLTPSESRALGALDADSGRTMRALAREWRCDASTATWLVDRLESKGLAERRSHETDRRVKLVVLTPKGATTRAEVLAATYTPPPELLELPRSRLTALRDASLALREVPGRTSAPD
jgi:DNA-binding MarR family transcriptional regulator